jgi:hypothetical protein
MHQTRKIIAVGRSSAVIIPPHIMDHLRAAKGDLLIFDDRYANFCLIVKGMIPPMDQIALDFPDIPHTATAAIQAGPNAEGQHDLPDMAEPGPLADHPPAPPGPPAISQPP